MKAFQVELIIKPIDEKIGKTKIRGVIIAKNASEMEKKAISEIKKDLSINAEVTISKIKELNNDFIII